jgi:hypothetical protein
MFSSEFVAGYLSSSCSFIEYSRGGLIYFALQVKTTADNAPLLAQIALFFEIKNKVYVYRKGSANGYSLLLIRNRQIIEKVIMPFLNQYLIGEKRNHYIDWRNRFYENSSTWNFRNINSEVNPDCYRIVDKNENQSE